jgi:general stress protein 26
MNEKIKEKIMKMAGKNRDAIVCSVDEQGFPAAKAMFRCANEGIKTFWFSTNTSAIRTGHFRRNPKACIYFVDHMMVRGVSLTGVMRVCDDAETKEKFWKNGDERYYPLGKTDPDYCILEFTAERGNYYHGLEKCLFAVSEVG